MLHNLRQALRREWSGVPWWRRWFESESAAETRDLDYVSSAAAAVMEQSPRGGQQLLWAIVAFVVVMLIWAGLAEVDEFTRGQGHTLTYR